MSVCYWASSKECYKAELVWYMDCTWRLEQVKHIYQFINVLICAHIHSHVKRERVREDLWEKEN